MPGVQTVPIRPRKAIPSLAGHGKGARRTDHGELRRAFGKQDALWSAIGEAIRRLSYAEIDSMTTYATKDAYQTP